MKRVLLSAALGIALLGAGAGGAYYYDLRQTPAPIRSACHAFESAYRAASARAQEFNDNTLQSQLAHPARASDYWHAAEEAKLEQGALILQRHQQELPETWAEFPFLFSDAVEKMTGQQTTDVGDGTTMTGPYGSVDQSNALNLLDAACIDR